MSPTGVRAYVRAPWTSVIAKQTFSCFACLTKLSAVIPSIIGNELAGNALLSASLKFAQYHQLVSSRRMRSARVTVQYLRKDDSDFWEALRVNILGYSDHDNSSGASPILSVNVTSKQTGVAFAGDTFQVLVTRYVSKKRRYKSRGNDNMVGVHVKTYKAGFADRGGMGRVLMSAMALGGRTQETCVICLSSTCDRSTLIHSFSATRRTTSRHRHDLPHSRPRASSAS